MLFLLSPAKTLDYTSPLPEVPHTLPAFPEDSMRLIEVLRRKSPAQIATLMDLSAPLAALNVARYQAWSPKFTARNARQAVLAFDGDVYDGLRARELGMADLEWSQQHLRILSGLYGVLRPLDWMQPYRLPMGASLRGDGGAHLFPYWGRRIAE